MTRGDALEEFNVIEFFTNTYETKINGRSKDEFQVAGSIMDDANNQDTDQEGHHRGRRRHGRVPYHMTHPKWKVVQRIIRPTHHNNLPNFIGRQLPRNDDPDTYDFYCASMLMLLKPWRNLHTDLKSPVQSWKEAFDAFTSTASYETQAVLSGIQYLHECQTAVEKDVDKVLNPQPDIDQEYRDDDDHLHGIERITTEGDSNEFNDQALEAIVQSQTSLQNWKCFGNSIFTSFWMRCQCWQRIFLRCFHKT